MFSIEVCSLPDGALLGVYQRNGTYTDCYKTDIPGVVTYAEYVRAFYTTPLFKLERSALKWMLAKPSSDADVNLLAEGKVDVFSAWDVEKRGKNQILMCDYQKRTRSWLMVELVEGKDGTLTRLYFGSAVVPVKNIKTGRLSLGAGFYALLWFHKIYSVALLHFARSRLTKRLST